MLMIVDVGEGGVSDLLMSAKIMYKSCKNQTLHKKYSMNIYARAKWVKSLLNIIQTNGLCTLPVKLLIDKEKFVLKGCLLLVDKRV